jgi:type IV pilus assembly protein PilC
MTMFRVKAATSDGRVIFKDIEAASSEAAAKSLSDEGLLPLKITGGSGFLSMKVGGRSRGKALKGRESVAFNQGLVSLLKSGLPLVECLSTMMIRSSNVVMTEALTDTVNAVKSGKTLSEAMSLNPEFFPTLYVASVRAGERTGDLVPSISGYIDYQKRMEALRKKVVTALTYPLVLSGAAMLIVAFLISYVVPTFLNAFMSANADLPVASRMLFEFSVVVKQYFVFIVIAVVFGVYAIRRYARTAKGKDFFDKLKLALPRLGEIFHGYSIAKFARTLSMTLGSGVNLIQALEMSKGVLNNSVLEKRLDTVIKHAREGKTVAGSMLEAKLMPEITLRMFEVGEKSANLQEILVDIADYHDDEIDHKVGILSSLIEPILMIVMGIVIGTIVVLIYLPIFQLGRAI